MPTFVSLSVSLLTLLFLPVPPDEEDIAQRPGLVASFTERDFILLTPGITRIVPTAVLDWGNVWPDPRFSGTGLISHLDGFIIIRKPGTYRFSLRKRGDVRVELHVGGKMNVQDKDVTLPFGMTPFRLEAHQRAAGASLAIDWSGPGFAREPLPASVLFHDPKQEQPDLFEDGRRLADRFACASCHAIGDMPRHNSPGPPLPGLAADLDDAWLSDWLVSPRDKRPGTLMPSLGMSRDEANELVAFLKGQPRSKFPAEDELKLAINVADASKGRLLFRSVGCLGCHPSPGKTPLELPPPAPRLDHLAQAGDALAVAAFLVEPPRSKLTSKHRPNLHLTTDESAHLARYLVPEAIRPKPVAHKATSRGKELFTRYRCASCHEFPKTPETPSSKPLNHETDASHGCLALKPEIPGVPRFDLTGSQRAALVQFVTHLPRNPSKLAPGILADDIIRRKNCLGCHAREGQGRHWLGAQLAELLKDDPALGSLKGTLTPPDLTAVGDKLRPEYLLRTIQGSAPAARPWLAVRMPVFTFDPGEAERLSSSLVARDHMPVESETAAKPVPAPDAAAETKAGQLLGQKGFGCVNCHVIAGRIPPGGEAETLGPDLKLAHQRMTERYFKRWLADPQRIIEGTPMPRFVEPIRTVSSQSFDDQLASIWNLLGTDRAERLASEGLKERLKRDGDRALVVRDMVVDDRFFGSPYRPRAIAIGLNNGQSLLFDADRLTWVAHWRGGFLYRTKQGRLWEWHIEGKPDWIAPAALAPIAFQTANGKPVEPAEVRERFGSFRELEFTKQGVKLVYTLRWAEAKEVEVTVTESIEPTANGWTRTIDVAGMPEGVVPLWRVAPREELLPMTPTSRSSYKAETTLQPTP